MYRASARAGARRTTHGNNDAGDRLDDAPGDHSGDARNHEPRVWDEIKAERAAADVTVRVFGRSSTGSSSIPAPTAFDTEDDLEVPDELHMPVDKVVLD
jgi:hypothetical protein